MLGLSPFKTTRSNARVQWKSGRKSGRAKECFETGKHASHSKEYTEGKSSQNLLLHQNFLEEL